MKKILLSLLILFTYEINATIFGGWATTYYKEEKTWPPQHDAHIKTTIKYFLIKRIATKLIVKRPAQNYPDRDYPYDNT